MITSGLVLIVFLIVVAMAMIGMIAAICGILFGFTGRSETYDRAAKKMAKAGNDIAAE